MNGNIQLADDRQVGIVWALADGTVSGRVSKSHWAGQSKAGADTAYAGSLLMHPMKLAVTAFPP